MIFRVPAGMELFQSTRPRGARRGHMALTANVKDFNPRAREGRDLVGFSHTGASLISIHAPARGATIAKTKQELEAFISIHAPARGATL